jgi:hypothetical protein
LPFALHNPVWHYFAFDLLCPSALYASFASPILYTALPRVSTPRRCSAVPRNAPHHCAFAVPYCASPCDTLPFAFASPRLALPCPWPCSA